MNTWHVLLFCQSIKGFKYYNWKCIIKYKPVTTKGLAKSWFLLNNGLNQNCSSFTNVTYSHKHTHWRLTEGKHSWIHVIWKELENQKTSWKTDLKMQLLHQLWLKIFVSVPILACILKKNAKRRWKVLEMWRQLQLSFPLLLFVQLLLVSWFSPPFTVDN